jgi:hypothetical protein
VSAVRTRTAAKSLTEQDLRSRVICVIEFGHRQFDSVSCDFIFDVGLSGYREGAVEFPCCIYMAAGIPLGRCYNAERKNLEVLVTKFLEHSEGILNVAETLSGVFPIFDEKEGTISLILRGALFISECLE